MESTTRFRATLTDMNNMGAYFYAPIIVILVCTAYILLFQQDFGEANVFIRKNFGVFSTPSIIIWIFYMFEDLLDSDGKETLISLPYNDIKYGICRVIKFTFMYILIFYIFYLISIIFYKQNVMLEFQDVYLPIASIFFYSALSFFIIVLVKRALIGFAMIGLYSAFLYTTRGGVSAYIYPFQWSHPNPYYSPHVVATALALMTITFYALGHLLFTKREFLMK